MTIDGALRGECAPAAEPLPADRIEARIEARDREGRARAVDPRFNVALEASAGTGKTRVLVDRYINLLRAGVDPANILAITFTRKAAAEMRERIVTTLRAAAERGEIPPSRWRELRDRTAEIGISTIDAFCLSLLREFPLEADLDPGFAMADDTEVPRLVDESLDRALRACRAMAREDEHVALVFAQLGDRRVRGGLAALLNRRVVAPGLLSRYLARGRRDLTVTDAVRRGASSLMDVFLAMRGGLDRFIDTGPPVPSFMVLERSLRALEAAVLCDAPLDPSAANAAFARAREYFLTQDGQPRSRLSSPRTAFASPADWHAHKELVTRHASAVASAYAGFRRDLNVLVSRGVWRMFRVAESEYRRTLEAHAVLDFPEVLLRTLDLLRQMEEFAQSRYRLEARYHHVLVDEFQDTSRAQWELIALLVQSWGEGAGLASTGPVPPSIFIVGDRKQSIYGFRDADVSVLREASRHMERLRPGGSVRRSISRSFRSVPPILAFVNDLFHDIEKVRERRDAFLYDEEDRFPAAEADTRSGDALGLIAAETPEACADATAAEIARLIESGTAVRDRTTGVARAVRAGDIAILFRTRESHREFEAALERRHVRSYVYKGLGFFDADETRDVMALLWHLAEPESDLRAAAWLRSRFVRLSDEGLRQLAPRLADAIASPALPPAARTLDALDRQALDLARAGSLEWRALADRIPPAELLDAILTESAYAAELRGPRAYQARENLKKVRALVRRIQNRGYATIGRIAAHLDRLAVGDEANAAVDAADAASLMTVHAAKGLEFPVVFVVNLARGTGNRREPIRVSGLQFADTSSAEGDTVSVSVGDFLSDADEDDAAREREETKRLLYVALTRARDRLYLASAVREGRLQPGRGSLAEVLPPSFAAQFDRAAAGVSGVQWPSSSGRVHALRVCPPAASGTTAGTQRAAIGAEDECAADFEPIDDGGVHHQSVVSAAARDHHGEAARAQATGDSARLVGTLVHRMLHRFGADCHGDDPALERCAISLLRERESVLPDPSDGVVERAVRAYRALCARPVVRDVYVSGEPMHEVPFTMMLEGAVVRGTIDCLVRHRAGDVTVLEFKTGRQQPEHAAQLELYRRAAEALFPGSAVHVMLVYAEEVAGA